MWLPPAVSAELLDERHQYEAEIARAVESLHGKLDYWNGLLREIDPHLQLVKAQDDTEVVGLRPGYYHVLRDAPGAPPMLEVHEGPNGEFREPDSGLLEKLRKGDMWNSRAMKARADRQLQAAASKERARERESEERADELIDRWNAANRVQVRV